MQTANSAIPSPLKKEKSSFYYSFSLLPADERDAIQQVYAFCRYTDDLVDEDAVVLDSSWDYEVELAVEKKRMRLQWWRKEVEKCYAGTATHPILKGLHKAILRFKIPQQYFMTLIDGVEMDLVKNRYETFDELKDYCYAVASIVGLICIEIFGYRHEETKEYAVDLGMALQLTNIIRDVAVDAQNGRIYLPTEDLQRFGYSERDLLSGKYNWQFVELMNYQSARARAYYHSARSHLRKDERFTMFAAEIMDAIYYRLLRKIELAEFNVFEKKIKVTTAHKLLIVSRFWLNRFFVR
jgi:15-cis-phytoene synthase